MLPLRSGVPEAPYGEERARTAPVEVSASRRELFLDVRGQLRVVRPRLKIGQSHDNDIVLSDPHVSRAHCQIEQSGARVVLKDLNSTNGTFVNGVRVQSAELGAGAVVTVGRSHLRVVGPAREETLFGKSEAIKRVRTLIPRLAEASFPVLIHGETGTGKELVARALHAESGRRGAFVPVNCGSIPRELVESELFGHERGAFTGAQVRRKGLFQQADGGTLFLDEIGELPLQLQPRLLRVLETGRVRPVGSDEEVAVTVRVVAATHVDLEAAVHDKQFRGDLYYRLAGSVLEIPALRQRREDIALLVEHFLEQSDGACRLSPAALERLCAHEWPGNVRELKNVIARAAALGGAILEPDDLQLMTARADHGHDRIAIDGRSFLEIEREIFERTLRRHGGNRRAAAVALGIPKSTLCDKVKRYGLE